MIESNPDDYKQVLIREFRQLLHRARQTNPLYFILNLHNGWGIHRLPHERNSIGSMDFQIEINRATTEIIFDKVRAGKPVNCHEMLFILLLQFESKAFYGILRNFVSIATKAVARQEPWKCKDMINGSILSTGKIINNLIQELKQAGFEVIAGEFDQNHNGKIRRIRNAFAHGNFRTPSSDTAESWIFANYTGKPPRHVSLERIDMSSDEVTSLFQKFLAFRIAFFDSVKTYSERLKCRSFSFVATNQMKPSQLLNCHYEYGSLSVKYQGDPLW